MSTEAAKPGDDEAELARLMKIPGTLEAYHGYMHGFHGFPFEGCDMTDIGPHEGPDFEAGLERGRMRSGRIERSEVEQFGSSAGS